MTRTSVCLDLHRSPATAPDPVSREGDELEQVVRPELDGAVGHQQDALGCELGDELGVAIAADADPRQSPVAGPVTVLLPQS